MKKLIFISLAIISMIAFSCTEDFSDPRVLSGTNWRCTNLATIDMYEGYDYIELRFTSTSTVESWIKEKSSSSATKNDVTATYSINDKTITIVAEEYETLIGLIDNKTMTLIEDGNSLVFKKQ